MATEFSNSRITKFTRDYGQKVSNMESENLSITTKFSTVFGMKANLLRKLSRELLKR